MNAQEAQAVYLCWTPLGLWPFLKGGISFLRRGIASLAFEVDILFYPDIKREMCTTIRNIQ